MKSMRGKGGCVDCIYECKDIDETGRLRGIAEAIQTVKTKNGQRDVCARHAQIHLEAAAREAAKR